MNRVWKIFHHQFSKNGGFNKTVDDNLRLVLQDIIFEAQEQTALEFSKWKDENYLYLKEDRYINRKYLLAKTIEDKYRTNEQIFNEFKNT